MGLCSRVEFTKTSPQELQKPTIDTLALLKPIEDNLSKATLRQMSRVIFAMLAMTGRLTMLGLSRWAEAVGSYRSIQRFYTTAYPWAQVFWITFTPGCNKK